MSFLDSLNISGSALTAQKLRMDVISSNIANASTTRTDEGGPYRRKLVVLSEATNDSFSGVMNSLTQNENIGGVEVSAIVEDQSDFKPVYDPDNPAADANGYVMMPNVDTVDEMVDMMSASRSYEASITAFNAVKLMATKALDIGR